MMAAVALNGTVSLPTASELKSIIQFVALIVLIQWMVLLATRAESMSPRSMWELVSFSTFDR